MLRNCWHSLSAVIQRAPSQVFFTISPHHDKSQQQPFLLALAAGALSARQDTPDSTAEGNPTVEPADVNVDKLKGTKHKYGSPSEEYEYRGGAPGLGGLSILAFR